MLTFLMQKAVRGKKAVVMVLDPDDIDRMKMGKPIRVDFAQDQRNKLQAEAVIGFTPDRKALQEKLGQGPNGRWKVDARTLLLTLEECKDLPERRSGIGTTQ